MKINLEANDILKKITSSLSNKEPLLITRFGEGEMRMFLDNHESEWIIRNMVGYLPSKNIMKEIRENMEIALINSDITGLPSFNGLVEESDVMKSDLHPLYKEIYNRFRLIFKKYKKDENNYSYCDVNVHSQFKNQNLFSTLLEGLNDLTIITCRDVESGLKKKYNIKNIKTYKIPPEYRFEDDPSKVKFNFYPEVHSEIKKQILKSNNEGKLCLYGAGLIGKDLGYYFKNNGGIAFDIGSVFDYWAGKVTRGKGKGRGVYTKSPLS